MLKNKSSFTAGFFIATGAFLGAWLVSKFYEKKLVNGDVIVGNVRRLFTVVGTIELVKNKKNWYNTNFMQMPKQGQF